MEGESSIRGKRLDEVYSDLRPLLFSIAYRMLGSVAEAEDLVQEAFVRYQTALKEKRTEIGSPKAYLAAAVTRLAIDHLRSARVRREQYIGEWLPEPVLTGDVHLEGARVVDEIDSLSMAFLLVLERLTPVERAVFLLHDVFDYGYDEIARIVGKGEDNCRQLAARARRRVREEKPRFEVSRQRREELADRFFDALYNGNLSGLVELLAEDAMVYGDGGGKVPASPKAVVGRERVVRLLLGISRQGRHLGATFRRTEVNGQPGALFFDASGRLIGVITLDIVDGRVQAIRSVINPDKLNHLGPVADVRAQLSRHNRNT